MENNMAILTGQKLLDIKNTDILLICGYYKYNYIVGIWLLIYCRANYNDQIWFYAVKSFIHLSIFLQ